MKKWFAITSLIVFMLLYFTPVKAQETEEGEEEDTTFTGEVNVGAHGGDVDGYEGKVAEYIQMPDPVSPNFKLFLEGEKKGYHGLFLGDYWDTNEQQYRAYFDAKRVLKIDYDFNELQHWLDNDPLDNLMGRFGGCMITHENLDLDTDHIIVRGEHRGEVDLTIPQVPNLRFDVGYREEYRKGTRQAIAVSHCTTCHATSRSREVDQKTRDVTAMATLTAGIITADYTFLTRDFTENGATPRNYYEPTIHPVRGGEWTDPDTGDYFNYEEIFGARTQYGDEWLDYNQIPDTQKYSHRLRANLDFTENDSLLGVYVNSNVENQFTALEIDYSNLAGKYIHNWGRKACLTARGRWQSIDNDDVFVDVINSEEYESRWGGNFDYTRYSSLSRNIADLDVDFSYRPSRRLNLRGGFQWEETDRDYYEVAADSTKTREIAVKLACNARPVRDLRFRVRYEHQDIKDPFMFLQSSCESDIDSLDYREYYKRRQFRTADRTSVPTRSDQLRATGTWRINSRLQLLGTFNAIDQANNETTYADWTRTNITPALNLVWMAAQKVSVTLGYSHIWDKTETLFSIPNMFG